MRPAVSVIVPIYKVELYIEMCARSLFEQTLDDVEFIFVNDGTPDASMTVLRSVIEEYPLRAPFVKIIEKDRNEGAPAARKTGLEHAEGEYVVHCDSDDWAEPDYLAKMYAKAHEFDADAVVCGYFEDEIPLDCKEPVMGSLIAVKEMVSLWRFLFRRDLYSNDIIFPENHQGDDHTLIVQLAYFARIIYCVNEPLYHWRVNMDSITRNPSVEGIYRRFKGACANAGIVESFFEREGVLENYRDEVNALKLYSMFYLRPLLRQGEGIEEWRAQFPEIKGNILFNKHIKFANKVEYLLVRYCPASIIKTLYRWRSFCR